MITLTVGYISGIIAAAIFILQFLVPNALIVILVGILGDQHTAVTWSVVERDLVSSLWPLFLRADSTATTGVDRSVRLLTWVRPLVLGLITIAAVVTPLGLYDAIEPGRHTVDVKMTYVPDSSPFGYGTPSRPVDGFSRKCGDFAPLQCPGTTVVIQYGYANATGNGMLVSNATIPNDDYDVRIPKVLAERYQSGLAQQQKSVSSFFDIQSRFWGWTKENGVNHNTSYAVNGFQMLSSVVLDDALEVIEGLVVDTMSGAVGFRNHTVPTGVEVGAEWDEDLLFIEPETECVNLNVSIEFRAPYGSIVSTKLTNISLVDNGGFSDSFVTHYPKLDLSNSQTDPQLRNRAFKAAWMTNAYSMLTMNLTRPSPDAFAYMKSKVGDHYTTTTQLTPPSRLNGVYITSLYSYLMNPDVSVSNYSLVNAPGSKYSNPFGITSDNYTDVSLLCSGAGGRDTTNMSNVHVECGLLFGAARRRDGQDSLIYEPGAWYTQPIYSCASATKASIKTVQFRYNATAGHKTSSPQGPNLQTLTVQSIKPKEYTNQESMPIWGVETVDFALHDLTQLWGLISPEHEHDTNLTTRRGPHLYLPGYGGILSPSILGFQSMAGTTGPEAALKGIYEDATNVGASNGLTDYSGSANMAMLSRWRKYCQNETTAAKILNLIWTDFAANLLVGTKSWDTKSTLPANLQKRAVNDSTNSDSRVPVTVLSRQIRYKWYFAIPALLSLLLVVLLVLAALLLMALGRGRPSRINHYQKSLSAGRLLGAMQYPAEDEKASTKTWIKQVGCRQSDLCRQGAAYGAPSLVTPFFGQATTSPEKSSESLVHQPMNGGSPPKGGYAKVNTYDRPADEIFGHARL